MTKVVVTRTCRVSVNEMWERVGDFHGIHTWHPAIASCESREGGVVRVLTVAGGGEVVETLLDHGDHFYAYRIDESPLPVADYTAMLRVKESEPMSCEVEWEAEFQPAGVGEEEAVDVIRGIFEAGLNALVPR